MASYEWVKHDKQFQYSHHFKLLGISVDLIHLLLFFWLISRASTKSDSIPVGFILLQQIEIITDAKKTDFLLI